MHANTFWHLSLAVLWLFVAGMTGCKKPPDRRKKQTPRIQIATPPQLKRDVFRDPDPTVPLFRPSSQHKPSYPVVLHDDRGKRIEVKESPKRIVVGGTPLYTEILFDLGAHKRLVGVAQSPNHPPEVKNVPTVGQLWPLNVEMVLSKRPDIVFCAMASARQKLEEDAGVTVFTGGESGGYIRSIKALYTLIRNIDMIVYGHTQRSEQLIQHMKQELHKMEEVAKEQEWVRAAIVYLPKPQSSQIYAIGDNSSPGSALLRRARGRNVFATQKSSATSIEALMAHDPEVILTDPKHIELFKTHRALGSLRALKTGRIYGIKASHYTSSRLPRVFRQLLKALHPTLANHPALSLPKAH